MRLDGGRARVVAGKPLRDDIIQERKMIWLGPRRGNMSGIEVAKRSFNASI